MSSISCDFSDEEGQSSTSRPRIPIQCAEFLQPFNPFGDNFTTDIPAMFTHYQNLAAAQASEVTPNQPKKKKNVIKRDRVGAENSIMRGYFNPPPERTYTDKQFRLRYRMQRPLFQRIVDDLANHDPFFQQKPDACGVLGFSPIHKCTVAMRHLAYGCAADQQDETFQIGETTTRRTVEHFVKGIIRLYSGHYLRQTSPDDLERLKYAARQRGFPGMIGSIDCMHWQWQNCPVALRGQYQGRSGKATVILEAVASYDTFIWHAFFGMAGSNNDINVLNRSDLFDDMCEGRVPTMEYVVNGNTYNHGYYLTDGIYPRWAAFIPAYISPNDEKRRTFTRRQESLRKDVERAFGILQARFAIIRRPAKYWSMKLIRRVMIACVILHNMIVEDERDTYGFTVKPCDYEQIDPSIEWQYNSGQHADLADYRRTWGQIRSRNLHDRLLHDLTEHVALHEATAGNQRN